MAVFAQSKDRGHPNMDLVFVADESNCRVQSFRDDGALMKQWGSRGSADGQFVLPSGMAVLARSQDRILVQSQDRGHPSRTCIFVTDWGNHRVQVFGVDGSFIHKWGSEGGGDGQFYFPHGVAVLARSQDGVLARSQDGVLAQSQDRILARSQDRILQNYPTQDLVFVADSNNHRVQVFNPDGTFIRKWGTHGSDNGQFLCPWGVAVHSTRDLVFISEFTGCRIQAFRSDGTFLFKWGSHGDAEGQFQQPKFLALHSIRDQLLVVDNDNHRVQVFDLNGSFVCKWGSEGQADGEFFLPSGVAVHPTRDMVYITNSNRVQTFSLFPNGRKRKRISDV